MDGEEEEMNGKNADKPVDLFDDNAYQDEEDDEYGEEDDYQYNMYPRAARKIQGSLFNNNMMYN